MQAQKRTALWVTILALTFACNAAPAHADMGVPMLAIIWPGSWVLLIPIIALEAWVATRMLKLSWWPAIKVAGAANFVTTVVGIPLTWAIALLAESVLGMFASHLGHGGTWMWHAPYNIFLMAAWMPPPMMPSEPFWPIPAACLVLCVPMYAMSAWWEGRIARQMLGTSEDRAAIRWGWRANLVSYTLIVLILLFWLIQSILTKQTVFG